MNLRHLYTKLLTLAITLCPMAAQADGLHFTVRTLPTRQQMPVANVRCVFQDSEGMMWYGTQGGGLCRDNGYQVNTFRSDARTPGLLADNYVHCIAEDGRGRVWFGTNQQLYTIDKHTLQLRKQAIGERIAALKLDSKGRMWVGAQRGVYCIDTKTDAVILRDTSQLVRGSSQFVEDSQHRLWVATWGKTPSRYSESRRRLETQPWHCPYGVEAMAEDVAAGGYWVATWGGGVVFYDAKTGATLTQEATLGTPDKQDCIDILLDRKQGLLWVTTLDNLYVYRREGRKLVEVPTADFLPVGRKIVDHLCEDRAGNVWVASFTPNTFIVSPSKQSLTRIDVPQMAQHTGFPLLPDRMVAEAGGSQYWIWQGRRGLLFYDLANGKLTDIPGDYARCIAKSRQGDGVWASSGKTLYAISMANDGTQPNIERKADFDNTITFIGDEQGQDILVGTRLGLYRYYPATGNIVRLCSTPESVVDALQGADGIAYLVTSNRLIRCKDKADTLAVGIGENFTALALASDGRLYAATQQGSLYTLADDSKTLVRDERMSNANGDAIIDVATDLAGHVWLLSNQYAREFHPATYAFRTFRSGDADIDVSYFYKLEPLGDKRMGLCGAGAYCQVESSQMLDRKNPQGARTVLTAIGMDDSLRLCDGGLREVEVEAGTSSVVLYCSTLEHLDAAKVAYAYRLDGGDWVYLPQGVNTVYLSRLPKGVTHIMLKATDRYGCWSPEVTELAIDRLPYWWETWWAYCLYLAIAVGVAYGLWRLNRRIRYMLALQRHRKTLALTEVEVKVEELEKADGRADDFLKKAVTLVEAHLADTEYSVEAFSSDMCMSRMSLYRKMQAVTGLSPNEFIRDIRLKNAASILRRHPGMTATQVAARVGFATPKYFSKCFKEKFGVSPAQYATTNNEETKQENQI